MTRFPLLSAAADSRPAGAAPVDQILIATGAAVVLIGLLGVLAVGHRTGRTTLLQRLMDLSERSRFGTGLAGWAMVPLLLAMASLITALLGMYWDIALHIGVGRDEGPLANPAHFPIMFGLFGVSASGVLACVLARDESPGPAAVRLSRNLHAPVGGVLLTGAGSYALLGFPLDDVWHRIFGQDVTLWGPTHLMLIGGAGLSLVAMAILYEEGQDARASAPRGQRATRLRVYLHRSFITGGMLIGLSVFQAEFDFGVPQFRLVLQPFLIAVAAAIALVTARLWTGRGGALAAVLFYLVVRGGVSVVVGPGLGELWAGVPLYLGEALCVELAALFLARRPVALGALAGALIGTLGFWTEFAWTQVAFPLPWNSDIAVEGMLLAVVGGVAGGVLGALLVLALQGRLTTSRVPVTMFALSLVAITACAADGLIVTRPADLSATMEVSATEDGRASAAFEFDRPPVDGSPAWLMITGWQGGGSEGLHIDHLRKVSPTRYETTEELPVEGSWKTMVRLQDGRHIAALPVYLPADEALDEDEVAATDGAERKVGNEKRLLQRELKDGVPSWLWLVAGLVVLLCSLVLVLALGWGARRYSAHRRPVATDSAPDRELAGSTGAG